MWTCRVLHVAMNVSSCSEPPGLPYHVDMYSHVSVGQLGLRVGVSRSLSIHGRRVHENHDNGHKVPLLLMLSMPYKHVGEGYFTQLLTARANSFLPRLHQGYGKQQLATHHAHTIPLHNLAPKNPGAVATSMNPRCCSDCHIIPINGNVVT